ncbi:Arylsulfatase [Pirellulimonas nuda]|uniref:Arylsulfatase n=1 Tax=Pirellulimonas nuda TaxID=2528009 RepID=A0A518DHN5_9BACT|nr:sulfatase [Pirellulimonas nuda]QDU90991.1 Arylsulfatase [Pirellulimonas nuda]
MLLRSLLFLPIVLLLATPNSGRGADSPPNVLLILVDDLKPALGCYGDPVAVTPSIDRLAASGLRFENAYANQAVCAPSRYTLMLGSRATSTGLYGLGGSLRKSLPDAVTMPQWFSRHGYYTQSLGKVFHIGHGNPGHPESFDAPHFKDKVVEYVLPESTGGKLTREEAYFNNAKPGVPNHELPRGAAWEAADVADDAYADGRVAAETIRRLEAYQADPDRPFFIAAGFARPHLPFTAPKRYWDLYDPAELPMPEYAQPPAGAPGYAAKRGGEITQYKPLPERGQIGPKQTRRLIHGYYASVSYVDAQIGRVLDALDRLGLAEDTIVVLWGDHGFHLGDHGYWTKHTNYEQATRIPLLVRAPGVTTPGSAAGQPAESVDIFLTLAELAGLPAPRGPQPIDGLSLAPVLRDPEARVDDHVYHCFPKGDRMGRAVRTQRHRLVEWRGPGQGRASADLELYDYQTDPLERTNLAAEQPETVARLRAILDQHPEAVSDAPKPNRPGPRPKPNRSGGTTT